MRFKPYGRYTFVWTARKELAALRKMTRERESAPLFAEQIAELQPSIEEVRAARAAAWGQTGRRMRDARARDWRKVRSRLALIPLADRAQIRRYWNQHPSFPGDPFYLSYVLRRFEAEGLASIAPVTFDRPLRRSPRG